MKSIWRGSLLAGMALVSAYSGSVVLARSPVPAPRPQSDELCVDSTIKGVARDPDIDTFRLRVPWQEVEGVWRGKWTLVDPNTPGHYRAEWRNGQLGQPAVVADLYITIAGQTVSVRRFQLDEECQYTGTVTGDGWRVSGTYTCARGQTPLPWSAAMGPGFRISPPPPCNRRDQRLSVAWRETEGAWRGDWQPYGGGSGAYRATWRQSTESASAGLQISITGTEVTILRSEASKQCHYSGRVSGNGWNVSGTYYCDGSRERNLPWSAVIGEGRPPVASDAVSPLPGP